MVTVCEPCAQPKGTGRPRKLTPTQERQVYRWVHGKRPDQYGFDFGVWTRQIVQELLLTRFGVKLSLAAIGTLLARLGLTAQKPLERAYQRDPEAVARWKNETFPAIASEAKVSGAEILFWDEPRLSNRGFHAGLRQTGSPALAHKPSNQCRRCRATARRSVGMSGFTLGFSQNAPTANTL